MTTSRSDDRLSIDAAPPVLKVSEAAQVLRIGVNQTYAAIRRGEIYAARIGRTLRVPRRELERVLGLAERSGAVDGEVDT